MDYSKFKARLLLMFHFMVDPSVKNKTETFELLYNVKGFGLDTLKWQKQI